MSARVIVDPLVELVAIRRQLEQLLAVSSGEFPAVPRRYRINAAFPFHTFKVAGDRSFHSVKIDNPSGAYVEVNRSGRQPFAGDSDERVPPRTGRILTAPFEELAIGIDPANMPAADTILYVTFYARPLVPETYDLSGDVGVDQFDAVGNLKTGVFDASGGGGARVLLLTGGSVGAISSLAVMANTFAYDGANNVPLRTSTVFKVVSATITGETTIWTPSSGKKFRLMGGVLGTTTASGIVTLRDNTGGSTIFQANFPIGQAPAPLQLGNGILSAAANNPLTAQSDTATTKLVGVVYGTEE